MAVKALLWWLLVLQAALSLQQQDSVVIEEQELIPHGVGLGPPLTACLRGSVNMSFPLPLPMPLGELDVYSGGGTRMVVQTFHKYPMVSYGHDRVIRNVPGIFEGWMNFTVFNLNLWDDGPFFCLFGRTALKYRIWNCGQELQVVDCGRSLSG